MQPSESKQRFEQFVAAAGRAVDDLGPADAAHFVLAFYRQVRADDCPLDQDGDMLLFQWGAHDFGQGETYRYDLTRQFIAGGEEEDDQEMSQLSLTLHFAATAPLRALAPGKRWCALPAAADEFARFVARQEVTALVAPLRPSRIMLEWSLT